MAPKGSLRSALDTYQGKDHRLEHQKKLQKAAEKAKAKKRRSTLGDEVEAGEGKNEEGVKDTEAEGDGVEIIEQGVNGGLAEQEELDDGDSWEEDEFDGIDISRIDDTDSDSELEDEPNGDQAPDRPSDAVKEQTDLLDEDEEDIPLSDLSSLSSFAKEDIISHQRLQINNTTALLKSLKSITLPISTMTFSEHQSLTTMDPVSIPDVNDDLNRELAFYKQSLDAVKQARSLLKAEGVPFSRPSDYFAEMVKSDEHMGRIKEKLVDEAARKKASAEARKQRDLKKFGKQVQVAKLQERDKAKRETLDRIQTLKRKRQNGPDTGDAHEADDLFDVTLEDTSNNHRSRTHPNATNKAGNIKRQKRDEKFGFGGKKRFSKSGDAFSSGDLSRFSTKKMKQQRGGGGGSTSDSKRKEGKSKGGKVGQQRLGKSRRAVNRR